jgi:DNA-binding CsgD family transcriptional regulator/PAS domain-containing protein
VQAREIDAQLVDAIYGAAAQDGDWNPALDRFRILLDSCEASLTVWDHSDALLTQETASRLLTDDMRDKYCRHYGALDPKIRILARGGPGYLFNDADHFDEAFVGRDPFYQEFSRPIGTRHTLDMLMLKSSEKVIYLAAMRSAKRGAYDHAAAHVFCQASRHFLRAIELKEKLEFAARAAGALDQLSTGIIIVGEHGRIELANRPARALFDSTGGLRLYRGKLSARSAQLDDRLQGAIARALTGVRQPAVLRVPCGQAGAWVVWIMPLPAKGALSRSVAPAALVVMGEPARVCLDVTELTALYGFTNAEAELAVALGNGGTLNEIAMQRGVKMSTVRTQLLSVLGKMGLHRQADLTRILASFSWAAASPQSQPARSR